jgi:hypothetical protein
MARIVVALLAWMIAGVGLSLAASGLTDQQIAEILVRESRQAYYATGHPCACPDDRARNGSRCGRRSAYSRLGGASPYCYVTDVPAPVIARYRATH